MHEPEVKEPTIAAPPREKQVERNGQWQHLVDHCLDLFERFDKSEYRAKKIESIRRSCEVYAQEVQKGVSFPWADAFKMVLPLYTITLDNLEPRMVSALVGKSPYIKFDMEGMTKQDPPTEILEDWYNSELRYVVKVEQIARGLIHKLLKEGTIYVIPSYCMEDKTVLDFQFAGDPSIQSMMDPMTGAQFPVDDQGQQLSVGPANMLIGQNGEPSMVEKQERVYEGVRTEILEFGDVLVDDFASDWEKADLIRKVDLEYGELMREKDRQGSTGYIKKNITADLLGNASDDKDDEEERTGDVGLNQASVLSKKKIAGLECHISYVYREEGQADEDVEDWTEERVVALIARDTKTLLRLRKLREIRMTNEQIIRRCRLFDEPNLAYGCSLFEKLRGIQEGSSDVFNLFLNTAILIILPWYLYSNKAGIKAGQTIQPGMGVECDDPSGVVFPKFNMEPGLIMKAIEIFFQMWEKAGNIGDVQTGQINQGKADVKATEIMAAIQEANIKFNYNSNTVRDDFVDFLRTVYDLYYQHMPFDKKFQFRGQEIQIPRQDMRRKYKFRLMGSTDLSNKLVERRDSEQMYATFRQDPLINPVPIIEKVLKAYDSDMDPAEIIDQDVNMYLAAKQQNPELPQVIGQYLQQKAVAQQAQAVMTGQQPGQGGKPPQAGPQGPPQPQGGPPPQGPPPQQQPGPQGGPR